MSPGEGSFPKTDAATPASRGVLTARYRAARARLTAPVNAGQPLASAPAKLWSRPSCGPTCWLPDLIAFNEEVRQLFGRATVRAASAPGERIRDVVAAHYGITRADLVGRLTTRRVARPRQVAMYICARHAGLSAPDVARLFGDRDQTTVRFAVRAVAARMRKDQAAAAQIRALVAKCRLGGSA
jgi:hypothetical protein